MSLAFGQRVALAVRALVGAFPVTNPSGLGAGMLSGVAHAEPPGRTSDEFLKAYSTMPWLRAVTHRVGESVASVRWRVFAIQRAGRFRQTMLAREMPEIRRKMLWEAKQEGELREIEDTPLLRVLLAGNPTLTGGAVRRVTQIYLDLLGEAFWLKERNRAGVPEAVWPVAPTWVRRTPTPDQPTYEVSFRGWQGSIPDTEMLWFRDPNPSNPYGRGSGMAGALGDELDIDEYAAKYTKAFFYNSAIPPVVVSPKQDSSHNTWSETQRRQMQQSWQQQHQGFWRSFKTMFAPVPLEIQQLMHSFREQQLGELRAQERDIIVQVFGLPPETLGILQSSNRATIEAADFLFAKNVLIPRLEHLRETLQERLVPEYDARLILEYDDPTPDDKEHRLAMAKAQPQALMQNEWRALMGFDPVPTGDVHHVPTTVVPQIALDAPVAAGVVAERLADVYVGKSAHGLLKLPQFVDDAPDDEFYLLVHRVADRLQPKMQRRFLQIIRSAQLAIDEQALAAALRQRLLAQAEAVIPFRRIVEDLRQAASETFRLGVLEAGKLAGNELNEQLGVSIGFNEASPEVAAFAESQTGLLVTRIDETTRAAIRQAIERAFDDGRTMEQVAQEIREKLGLLPRQEQALDAFRIRLIEQGRNEAEIVRRVAAQARAMLRKRAQLIARTEMIDAANEGQQQLWRQAVRDGVLDPHRARRFWVITPDDRLDLNICEPIPELNPEGVRLDEPFQTPSGLIMRPTAHPGCRCTTTLRIIG